MRSVLQLLCVLTLLLVGCTSFAPDRSLLGRDRAAVIADMGPPSRERELPSGSRLEYPRGPFGKSTYFVVLDANGKVTGWDDVLTTENFDKIKPGMPASEVEFLIGESKSSFGVGSQNHRVWNYPFNNSICRVFQVEVTPDGKVDSTGYGYAPECGNTW
jgi:hypothetical protein